MGDLTETKDLKTAIIINIIILMGTFISYVAAFFIGAVNIAQDSLVIFTVTMLILGLMMMFPFAMSIKAIMLALGKMKINKEELKNNPPVKQNFINEPQEDAIEQEPVQAPEPATINGNPIDIPVNEPDTDPDVNNEEFKGY